MGYAAWVLDGVSELVAFLFGFLEGTVGLTFAVLVGKIGAVASGVRKHPKPRRPEFKSVGFVPECTHSPSKP